MAPDTEVRPTPAARRSVRFQWWWLAAAAAVIVAVFAASRLLDRPSTVSHVDLVNSTAYPLQVEVTDAGQHGWMPLGTAQPKTTTTIDDVIDQGGTWIVRFSRNGVVAAEVHIARADLADAGWRITVPPDAATTLAAAGVEPPTP
jgi:hypothetical protein